MPTTTELIEAQMRADAHSAILSSAEWLTAEQIIALVFDAGKPLTAMPDQWLSDGTLFAIEVDGQYRYPDYGLDPANGYRPLDAMANVIAILSRRDGWQMASWFLGANSWLGGARPLDVIVTAPARVIEAAKQDNLGIQHG